MLNFTYIGIGSNLGNKEQYINKSLKMLDSSPGTRVNRVASLYRTAPLGYKDQDWFLNTVAEVETILDPYELLYLLLDIEDSLERVRTVRWGPRTVDLDLLLYGNRVVNSPELTVPHPRLGERAFVLVPLAELEPELVIPGWGPASVLAEKLAREQSVEIYARRI